jgi:hypothetical protein
MLAGIIGGSVHGGISTQDSAQKLETQLCNLNGSLSSYVTLATKDTKLYSDEYFQQQQKLNQLKDKIGNVQQDIKLEHENYKKTITFFKIAGIGFGLVLIFIFFTKKVILKETAMKK